MKPHVAAAVAALVFLGCASAPPPGPAPDRFVKPCHAACENQRRLGCDVGKPTFKGTPCEAVCENAQENGVTFGTTCLSNATTCAACR